MYCLLCNSGCGLKKWLPILLFNYLILILIEEYNYILEYFYISIKIYSIFGNNKNLDALIPKLIKKHNIGTKIAIDKVLKLKKCAETLNKF